MLGVHIFGEDAAELLHIGQAVLLLKGKITYFIHTVFNYPTLAECYKAAAFNGMRLRPAARESASWALPLCEKSFRRISLIPMPFSLPGRQAFRF